MICIHGDVRFHNIIYGTKLQRYQLINYRRTFHESDLTFPPMSYMIQYDEVPTKEDDLERLNGVVF